MILNMYKWGHGLSTDNPKFLIIDSNRDAGDRLGELLSTFGISNLKTGHPSETTALLANDRYDCILIDKSSSQKWRKNLAGLATLPPGSMVFLTGAGKPEFDSGSLLETADGYFQVNPESIHALSDHVRKASGISWESEPDPDPWDDLKNIILSRRIVRDKYPEDISVVTTRCDGSLGILFGDFTGPDQIRNLGISHFKQKIQTCLFESPTPGHTLDSLNHDLLLANGAVNFLTAVSAFANIKKHRLTFSIAGHIPILHRRWGSRTWRCLSGNGIPLGIRQNPGYGTEILHTAPGDRVLLLSDGILKPTAIRRKWLSMDHVLEKLDPLPIDSAPNEIFEHLGDIVDPENGPGLTDEFTAMLIQF